MKPLTKVEQLIPGDRFRIMGETYRVSEPPRTNGTHVNVYVTVKTGTVKIIPFLLGDGVRVLVYEV